MLTGYSTYPTYTNRSPKKESPTSCAISRLLAAAVINKSFRDLLLKDPAQALIQGYQDQDFQLNSDERNLILSIQAENLSDLALQIISNREQEHQTWCMGWIPVKQPSLVLDKE